MAEKISSTEKLATRSDYERGKLDGMAECVELLNEQARNVMEQMLRNKFKDAPEVTGFYTLPEPERTAVDAWHKAAKFIWVIYRRRVI